jgi:hypothetical protein
LLFVGAAWYIFSYHLHRTDRGEFNHH